VQVGTIEIEAQLQSHPAVAEAAVIAVDDEDAGERPFGFIVRSQKVMADVDEEALKKDINLSLEAALNESCWLRRNIAFVESIPKSHSGKAMKTKLKQSLVL
jgi:acyl-coenzyme A synthetase/AMP-(fatty) acid ligase